MTHISATTVKQLRDRTSLPMMDCKHALLKSEGNIDKAIEVLRENFGPTVIDKEHRPVGEGRIAFYHDATAQTAAMVEVRCESAPVTRTDAFIQLCADIARQVAETNPSTVDALLAQPFVGDPKLTISDRITEVVGFIQENMKVARFHRGTGSIGTYCHHDGTVGVMLEVSGNKVEPNLLKDICMHIAATNPMAGTREDVPAEIVAKEQAFVQSQMNADPKNAKKPAHLLETILTGKMNKWFAEHVLLEQPFVKDDSKKVGDLLAAADLEFIRFTRYRVGETSV